MSERDPIERAVSEMTRRRAAGAPGFGELVRRRRTKGRPLAIVAIAASLLAAILLWPRESEPQPDWSAWRAPSDVFLPPTAPGLAASLPPLGETRLSIYTGTNPTEEAHR